MMHKMQLVVIAAWTLVVSAPWIEGALDVVDVPPVRENRTIRKVMPSFSWSRLLDTDTPLTREYEAFLNDRLPLRDLLIRTRNQLDLSLFQHSDKLLLGPGGVMFYRDNMEEKQVYLERSWASHGQETVDRLALLAAMLASRGTDLLVAVIPQKHSIYPEWLPRSAPRLPGSSATDDYQERLARAGLLAVDMRGVLLRAKDETVVPLYQRTDFHWNEVGASIAAWAVRSQLQRRYTGQADPLPPMDVRVIQGWRGGGQLQSLAVFLPPTEWHYWVEWPALTRTESLPSSHPFEYRFQSSGDGLLPATVLFGDSFANMWLQTDFPQYFSELRWAHHAQLRKLVSRIPAGTRLVLLVHAEIHLQTMLNDLRDQEGWWPVLVSGSGF